MRTDYTGHVCFSIPRLSNLNFVLLGVCARNTQQTVYFRHKQIVLWLHHTTASTAVPQGNPFYNCKMHMLPAHPMCVCHSLAPVCYHPMPCCSPRPNATLRACLCLPCARMSAEVPAGHTNVTVVRCSYCSYFGTLKRVSPIFLLLHQDM